MPITQLQINGALASAAQKLLRDQELDVATEPGELMKAMLLGLGDRSCSDGSAIRQMADFGLVSVTWAQSPSDRQPVIGGARLTRAGRARAAVASADVNS